MPFQEGLIRILDLGENPTYRQKDLGYPQRILDEFYWPLFEARVLSNLLMLPTWTSSNGATQELGKACGLGTMAIEEMDPDWYEEGLKRSQHYLKSIL